MNNIYGFAILVIIVAVVLYLFRDKLDIFLKQDQKYPFTKKDFLLNVPERKFFEELKRIVPQNYVVFPQVLLSSIIKVNASRKEFWTYQNKINRKTIDFVFFELPYYKPVLGIEYGGKTHDRPDRMERDLMVSKMLENAGIKSFHIKHSENINFEEMKNRIDDLLPKSSQ